MNEFPNTQTSTKWLNREETSGKKIEQELNSLRQSNRLAVHMNEKDMLFKGERNPHVFNPTTWDWFRTAPEDIRKLLPNLQNNSIERKLPLISMSLLPSGQKSIMSYVGDFSSSPINSYGYFVDLNQSQSYAPVVVGASPKGMQSGEDVYRKNFWNLTGRFMPAAKKMGYEEWIKRCSHVTETTENNGQLSANMTDRILDNLAAHYSNSQNELFALNEIIVAASKQHVRAIVIPASRAYESENDNLNIPTARLAGALVGLQHLRQKPPINLPVVLYHTRENHGNISYVGQGKEELNAVALDAITTIQERATSETHKQFKQLQSVATTELGLELFKPLSEQKAQVQKLRGTNSAGALLAK